MTNRLNDSPLSDRLESVIKAIILSRLSTRRSDYMCYALMCYVIGVLPTRSTGPPLDDPFQSVIGRIILNFGSNVLCQMCYPTGFPTAFQRSKSPLLSIKSTLSPENPSLFQFTTPL